MTRRRIIFRNKGDGAATAIATIVSARMPAAPVFFVRSVTHAPLVRLEDDSDRPEFKLPMTHSQYDLIVKALAPIGAGDGPDAHDARESVAMASEAWLCSKPCPRDLCHIIVASSEE
ncbi:hypothetical protein R69619_00387 [Paraburkholderia nemoris]|uniref:hypothetical protein n=1 Tax=Paraburkholderia nemoris TaxID=2793076 RepID=UPI00190952C0|nr:hypothetical protein [Paraburkholderia nemoris]MBK3737652.1 hypothetical protein [Paraburkholderia aspalathi]CAE6693994.1 hypothetical protein R69619_00387 [Paraburkholderia nemoris]